MTVQPHPQAPASDKLIIGAVVVVIALYLASGVAGWPQAATARITEAQAHANSHASEPEASGHESGELVRPYLYTVTPFLLLLGAIAVFPLVPKTQIWWESNLNRFYAAAALGLATLLYFLLIHRHAIEGHFPSHHIVHPSDGLLSFNLTWAVIANAMLKEYIPFMMLLFSLYTISGGIRITGDLRAHPKTNTSFIALGGLLASFIGTTGAAMLLIRPLLETNSERKHVRHTVIFFIFVVCNCGGCLLPIGDPPLFLGYLEGVGFLWTLKLWPAWLFVNGALIGLYFVWDRYWCYPRETVVDIARDERQVRRLSITGLALNGTLLAGVVLSVALLDPSQTFPGTNWHPWVFLREIAQLGLVAISLILGSRAVRAANKFNYHAITEVAVLFFGIFLCMQPALQILNIEGSNLGVDSPAEFFWYTGSLSSVLDNAPTYLVFFKTAQSLPSAGATEVAGVAEGLLIAVSLGAVFMGAMTYIGNGPNFMVRAIAEKSGVRMPGFFGYMLWSCAILLPILAVTTFLFL